MKLDPDELAEARFDNPRPRRACPDCLDRGCPRCWDAEEDPPEPGSGIPESDDERQD